LSSHAGDLGAAVAAYSSYTENAAADSEVVGRLALARITVLDGDEVEVSEREACAEHMAWETCGCRRQVALSLEEAVLTSVLRVNIQ